MRLVSKTNTLEAVWTTRLYYKAFAETRSCLPCALTRLKGARVAAGKTCKVNDPNKSGPAPGENDFAWHTSPGGVAAEFQL
jgi:hypothetical protein